MRPDDVITQLGYEQARENWVTTNNSDPQMAQLWRPVQDIHVFGSYVFRTSPQTNPILPPKPAIHVVRAKSESEARDIHCKLWNLSTAPFLMVILPDQVRVYAGFNYDPRREGTGHIQTAQLTATDISRKLKDFYADEIDSGRIWQTQSNNLTPERRVDQRLLKNLEDLGDELVNERNVDRAVAHALIGKYIYIKFLKDRRILSERWLKNHGINFEDVLGRHASRSNLRKLVEALEVRFNGSIFPLDFTGPNAPNNSVISYVASVFRGDDAISGQLALDFQAYNFSYIPVETLSSIYEQFLRREGKGKNEGAVYTREFLADYVLCELNSVKPLKQGMKILDGACGSGVFLVLAYRRLIEDELRRRRKKNLPPEKLREILEGSIYGVEPIKDACYVAEFSLILTLLSYVDPPELDLNESFQFPALHNNNIFECDFFNDASKFWKKNLVFDWVVGNPSWTKLKSATAPEEQPNAWKWLTDKKNAEQRPVGKYSLSEAFSWRVTDVLNEGGYVGLLLHATSLFNSYSFKYRQAFFKQNTVVRITDFANLVYILFKDRAEAPAASFIYTKAKKNQKKATITHYGPFAANQVFFRLDSSGNTEKQLWTITIYEDEIQTVDPYDAESGDAIVWKLALWGTYRDRKAVSQLKRLFPTSLSETIEKRDWKFHQGIELRNAEEEEKKRQAGERWAKVDHVPELENYKRLNVKAMSGEFYLTVPPEALFDIPEKERYIRTIGGQAGLKVVEAPHIFWSPTFAAYSDLDFVLPAPQVGLAAPAKDADHLRAISAYLNSSFGQYLLFFHSASWGVDRNKFAPADASPVPIPNLSDEQVEHLAELHKELSKAQIIEAQGSLFNHNNQGQKMTESQIKTRLDNEIGRILKIPDHLKMLARDFTQIRYQLNKGKTTGAAAQPATMKDLSSYARYLVRELDDFAETHHKVRLKRYSEFVLCTVEITRSRHPYKPIIEDARSATPTSLRRLWEDLEQEFSQWVYVQRSLRSFIGKKLQLLKSSRLIDWTKTQALLDCDDIIAEVLND